MKNWKIMVNSKCCVPFCRGGYSDIRESNSRNNVRNPTLFKVPKVSWFYLDISKSICVHNLCSSSLVYKLPSLVQQKQDLYRKWKSRIKLDRNLTRKDFVCEKHFSDNVLIKHDSMKLKDGSVYLSERERYSLKSEAIPTIFPEYPSYLNSEIKKRKSPTKRKVPECIVS